jgi:hypothetical protein
VPPRSADAALEAAIAAGAAVEVAVATAAAVERAAIALGALAASGGGTGQDWWVDLTGRLGGGGSADLHRHATQLGRRAEAEVG